MAKRLLIVILIVCFFIISLVSVSAETLVCNGTSTSYSCSGALTEIGYPVASWADCQNLCDNYGSATCCAYHTPSTTCYYGVSDMYSQSGYTATLCEVVYDIPSFNIVGANNITNHEAIVGTTFLYNDYRDNLSVYWLINNATYDSTIFNPDDEFDLTGYYTFNLTNLDYETNYEYQVCIDYPTEGNESVPQIECDNLTQEYGCSGSFSTETSFGQIYGLDFPDAIIEAKNRCENYEGTETVSCCLYKNGASYGYNGSSYYTGQGSEASGDCTIVGNETIPIYETVCSTLKNFTTLDAYIPYITTYGSYDIAGTTATLTGTYYWEDYNSTVPFFRINDVDLLPKTNLSSPSEPTHLLYNITGLEMNTTYNYSFCVGYSTGWSLLVCNDTKTFTTGFEPTVTFGNPTLLNPNDVTLHWTIDWNGATDVTYKFKGSNPTWLTTFDGVAQSFIWDSLTAETNYTYWLAINYTTLGQTFEMITPTQYTATYYENAFDDVWDTLLQGSSFAKILLGFVVLIGIIFLGVGAFGKYNIQISMLAILIFTIIGSILASLMKLFPIYITILVIGGGILLMVLKNMFFNGENNG